MKVVLWLTEPPTADRNDPKYKLTQVGRSRATDVAGLMTLDPRTGSQGSCSSVVVTNCYHVVSCSAARLVIHLFCMGVLHKNICDVELHHHPQIQTGAQSRTTVAGMFSSLNGGDDQFVSLWMVCLHLFQYKHSDSPHICVRTLRR